MLAPNERCLVRLITHPVQTFRAEAALVEEEIGSLAELPESRRATSSGAAVAATIGVVLAGNLVVVIGRRLEPDVRECLTLAAIPAIGAVTCSIMRAAGWSNAALGIAPVSKERAGCWRRPGLVLAAAACVTAFRAVTTGGRSSGGADLRIATLRLVFGTALGEELTHRGALLGMWATTGTEPRIVVIANCAAFGAWHVAGAAPNGWIRGTGEVLGAAIGGALFIWGRMRSRSVAGSWLLHVATNLPGLPGR
jgi:membrane protease YdiL (CAAX protease family)